ncbi:MAG: hypothetical protein ABI574_12710 [Burkholderiales bacterium]
MWKPLSAFVAAMLAWPACQAVDLTPTETQWLRGAWPVIAFVKSEKLPLDIVVQPQASPGAAPLALAFVDGRCKLVLSMRGNPEAEATLERIEPDLRDATLELMAAHELGHCRRYLDGAWYGLPASFQATVPSVLSPDLRTAYVRMKAARREEGYGDLVGLAWVQQQRPQQYARLHAWLLAERTRDLLPGSHHDTLAWVRLAQDGDTLAGPSIFAAAARLWAAGLAVEE